MGMARVRNPKETRRRILVAAHDEFWRNGYRAGSLNGIVEAAGVTKGALFHHFRDKRALALAVVDDVLAPEIRERWIEPLENGEEVLELLGRLLTGELERIGREGEDGVLALGCPLANLAADATESDEEVRLRVEGLYREWREAVARALERGRAAGSVHPNIVPSDEAAFLIATLAGIATVGKTGRDLTLFRAAYRAASAYLETLRAPGE